MDRRDALKLLAGGTTLVVGATAIESSTAFADGGTAAFRPTCSTAAAVVTWSSTGNPNFPTVTITAGTTTCSAGWTGSRTARFTSTPGTVFNSGGTNVEGTFTTVGTGATAFTIRDAVFTDDLTAAPSLAVTVIVRRVCTNNANAARKAYCCTSYAKTAAWARGASDTWGGATSGNFGTGTTPVSSAGGCTAP